MENQENLVGPKPEDTLEIKAEEAITADGQPIWMAFLGDPEALSISPTETQVAKNAAETANPEVINNCRRVPLKDCINEVNKLAA